MLIQTQFYVLALRPVNHKGQLHQHLSHQENVLSHRSRCVCDTTALTNGVEESLFFRAVLLFLDCYNHQNWSVLRLLPYAHQNTTCHVPRFFLHHWISMTHHHHRYWTFSPPVNNRMPFMTWRGSHFQFLPSCALVCVGKRLFCKRRRSIDVNLCVCVFLS